MILFMILVSTVGHAQISDSIFSILKDKPTFFAKLDTRGSFVSNRHVRLNGIKAGLVFENKLKVGLGYSWLRTNYTPFYNGNHVDLKSRNFSTFIDYIFYTQDKLQLNANLQLGLGNLYYDLDGEKVARSFAVFYEQSATVEYRIIKYFGIGLGVGYRLVAFSKKRINENLSSPVYIARFKLYFGDMIKAIQWN